MKFSFFTVNDLLLQISIIYHQYPSSLTFGSYFSFFSNFTLKHVNTKQQKQLTNQVFEIQVAEKYFFSHQPSIYQGKYDQRKKYVWLGTHDN